jgi:hypothetical protein
MPKSGPMNEEWAETMRLRSIGDAILEIIRLTEETTKYGRRKLSIDRLDQCIPKPSMDKTTNLGYVK